MNKQEIIKLIYDIDHTKSPGYLAQFNTQDLEYHYEILKRQASSDSTSNVTKNEIDTSVFASAT